MPSNPPQPDEQDSRPPTFLDETWSWGNPQSWPLSIRFLPIAVVLVAIYIAVFFQDTFQLVPEKLLVDTSCRATFNYTFDIVKAKHHAETLATHDWEIGTTAEALLELLSPEKAVFGSNPFPDGKVPWNFFAMEDALQYVLDNVQLSDGPTIMYNNYSVSDPASLGVSAVMIGQQYRGWVEAATQQKDYLLKNAPRYRNGAVSHRVEVAELWSDAIHMFPPFLAYYGVATKDLDLVKEAVKQTELYRNVLMIKEGPKKGLWRHIVGPSEKADEGAWSTGNGWAAYGMARVRATVFAWSVSAESMAKEISALDGYIEEILEGAIGSDDHPSGLLRNYLGNKGWFADTAGTSLLAAAALRFAMFDGVSAAKQVEYLAWANLKREAVFAHIGEDGVPRPTVNSLKHDQREPFEGINPEAQSFLLMLGAAWRDCRCSGRCSISE